jgi:succinyl-CoA synthetase alpha subunit
MERISAAGGMLFYLIGRSRPEIAEHIKETDEIETVVVGLGRQGTRHAGLMQEFGTRITAGVAPGRGGTRVHETIPVYDNVAECLEEHPYIAAASIWRQYSTAKDATIEVIEAGIPIVVIISEGIPIRDVRDILVAAERHDTLLIGGNSPGAIFPPERVKIGMLPDIFYPEEKTPGRLGPNGVTIISRSGAILYHMSDALASAGIAQNAVIGVGGDAAIGSTFSDLVPVAMEYPHTDLVVIAGEIGGIQEERLAEDIMANPERYPKPIIAEISGAHAPAGKTMGHAGAIVAPGQSYGTFESKRSALEMAGVTVVNSQYDLIEAAKEKLDGTYFDSKRYYEKMRKTWEAPPKAPTWGTLVTKVEPNNLMLSGYPLQQIVARKSFLETAYLLVKGEFPTPQVLEEQRTVALQGVLEAGPIPKRIEGEDVSKILAKCLLLDEALAGFPAKGTKGPALKTTFALGRIANYLATILGTNPALDGPVEDLSFTEVIGRVLTGKAECEPDIARMLEKMIIASVDHGVTPPSAQATIIAASTRAPYEVAVAHGVGVITDVHGGAGAKAARFFSECVSRSAAQGIELEEAARGLMGEYIQEGRRIEGMGHRVHTEDPRRDILWKLADDVKIAGENVAVSKVVTEVFKLVRGMNLPINVDGVIGAIVADMDLHPSLAKVLFIWGRVAGLSAHYFEEIVSQPKMRRINFAQAVYKGRPYREVP